MILEEHFFFCSAPFKASKSPFHLKVLESLSNNSFKPTPLRGAA